MKRHYPAAGKNKSSGWSKAPSLLPFAHSIAKLRQLCPARTACIPWTGKGKKTQIKTVFILNFSWASRPKLSTDKDCLTTNITACCNYVKCKNRNRTSNHTHARQMESISPPSKRADRQQAPRLDTNRLFCRRPQLRHALETSTTAKRSRLPGCSPGETRCRQGILWSSLSETKEKAILLSGESPTRRRKGCRAMEAGWKAGEVPGAVQLTLPGCYALSQTKSSFDIAYWL